MKYKDLQKEDKRLFNSFMGNKFNKANALKIKDYRLEGEWFRRGASINNYLNSL
jgi:hypothetical protein